MFVKTIQNRKNLDAEQGYSRIQQCQPEWPSRGGGRAPETSRHLSAVATRRVAKDELALSRGSQKGYEVCGEKEDCR